MILEKIIQTARKFPDKQALVYGKIQYSYADLVSEINARAAYFQDKIASKNVLLANQNEVENLLNCLALMAIGKVSIFASKHINTQFLEDLALKHDAFVLSEPFLNEVSVEKIAGVPPQYKAQFSDIFLGVLSSGTEGLPKIIWKDYQSWVTAFPHQSTVFGIDETDRLLVLDALSYSANLNSVLHALWQGCTVVLTTLSTANKWMQLIEKEQISSIFFVPSHYRLLLDTPPQYRANFEHFKSVKSLVSAGEKLDIKTANCLLQSFQEALLTEYYGAAELGHISYHQGRDIVAFGYSVGTAFPEVQISINNNEIQVESPYISPDYRHKKTVHDLGYFDNGNLVILGRAGRMFNRRGLNVFAEEIENCLQDLPFVRDVAVVGKMQPTGSHDIFLVYSSFHNFSKPIANKNKEIKAHLLKKLPAAKRPRRLLELPELPHKDIGKIDYQAIARLFDEEEL